MSMPAFQTRLEERLRAALDDHGVPGAVVGIRRGEERAVVGAGVANVATGMEVTPETLFQIGSISKVFTATLVMQLVHTGLVELDEPVRGALQEFRVADDAATLTITPRHLLSHTSGIEGDHFVDCGRNPDALWRYVSTVEDLGQVHDPEDLFSYCNTGYGVLGRLIEEATGDHFTRAVRRRLNRPLGLQRTVATLEHAVIHRIAAGHRHTVDEPPAVLPWTLSRFSAPIGGILSTADDLLSFAGIHLHGGTADNAKQVLPSKAVTAMQAGEVEVPGTERQWGLGVEVTEWGDAVMIGHTGDTVGQRAFFHTFPALDAAVVVLTNSPLGDHVARACLEEAGEFLGFTPPPPPQASADAEPHADFTGIYERMHQRLAMAPGTDNTLRMTIIPDDLFVTAGQRERTLVLEPIDPHRYVTVDPETGIHELVVLLEGDEDVPDYVHYGLRAHHLIS